MTGATLDMAGDARFWDRIAEKYAASPVRDEDSYRHTLDRTRAHLNAQDRALEIGCGTGTTAIKLRDAVGSIMATDYSAGMIEIAKRKRADASAGNVEFAVGTVFSDTLETGAFDAVLAFNLFHLLDDPEASLQRTHALLRPGGVFISKTPCLGGRAWLYGPMIGVMRLFGRAPRVRLFSVDEWDARIEAAGFEIVETGFFPTASTNRFIVARRRE